MWVKFKNICIVFLIALGIFVCILLVNNTKINKKENNNEEQIELINFKIEDRERLFKENTVYIGENTKELNNGFYDFKISTLNTSVELTLNKLWYKEYGEDYIEDEYLIKIVNEVAKLLGLENSKEDIEYELYKYIKQNFLKVKEGENGQILSLKDITINSNSKDNQCVIHIKKER